MPTTGARRARSPLRRAIRVANSLTAAFVVLALATIVASAGRPPPLSASVKAVQLLPDKGVVVYGTLRGTFGPFRRGFGQLVGPPALDLVTEDGRYLTLPDRIEESIGQGILWPFHWARTEIWFSERLPPVSGFASIRVRIQDRLGNQRVSDDYPLAGGPGSPEMVPDDVRWLALPGIVLGGTGSPLIADEATLEAPRR
ncbi:MAG: hypothetical protein U0610_02220 [bacterium]